MPPMAVRATYVKHESQCLAPGFHEPGCVLSFQEFCRRLLRYRNFEWAPFQAPWLFFGGGTCVPCERWDSRGLKAIAWACRRLTVRQRHGMSTAKSVLEHQRKQALRVLSLYLNLLLGALPAPSAGPRCSGGHSAQ